MERYRTSRISVPLCVCTLLCFVASPGCRQKAEEPAPSQQSQQSEHPTDVNTPSTDTGQRAVLGEPVEFKLEEVSAFNLPEQIRFNFAMGQDAMLQHGPDNSVKAYPDFESNNPLYGSIWIDAEPGKADSQRTLYCFALDESAGQGRGYDRLYFDSNRDADLSDETALNPMTNPPDGAKMRWGSDVTQICFDYLTIDVDHDRDSKRKVEAMPRLDVFDSGLNRLCFVATRARRGLISMGGRKFNAFLGHRGYIGGSFDHPTSGFILLPAQNEKMSYWTGSDQLMAMHRVGNKLYRFSATPEGDKLFVQSYERPFGIFEIGAGGRDIKNMSAQGSLLTEQTAVPVAHELGKNPSPIGVRSCRLPIGDYLPGYLTITYGDLQIAISNNYYSDAGPGIRNKTRVYWIKLRREETFTLDFSNDPAVIFTSPAKDFRAKRGEELMVEAVLIDPVFDFMIRGLYDTSGSERNSLDPKVTIARADGEVVAEGVMPFG